MACYRPVILGNFAINARESLRDGIIEKLWYIFETGQTTALC